MKDDTNYLRHILDEIANVEAFTVGGEEQLKTDRKTQHAVVRSLEVIGEASKRISAELRSDHADIPWRAMAGMRDRLIHDYFGVDLDIVWKVVEMDLPALKGKLAAILADLK
jgi:uncharacterized protein with HEPN domain